uniref:39S ribosomal protein L37, mitochondrial n=1 Tax=Vespula vulgaris TaxID=7454 RepID=UPI00212AA2DB|nr:39S ribosomal protein L37, mitochondrial [Vespula vulgaris]XP_050857196.1 39S ribosomal protein L37, mitochondrial [Vespula vulgaris]
MKITQVLRKYHLGRLTRKVWYNQRERKITANNLESRLSTLNIKIVDPIDLIRPKKDFVRIEREYIYKRPKFDNTHPDWKDKVCLSYKDHNVLQQGLSQAQLLLKTIHIENELPQQIKEKEMDLSNDIHHLVERTIYTSNIFDAHQELLPKRKDPDRPAWNFPRDYGVTDLRKTHNLFKKLLQICECVCGPEIVRTRSIFHNGIIKISIEKEPNLLQFELTFDLAIVSTKPLTKIEDQNAHTELDFPNIYPFYPTLSLEKMNIYRTEDLYPIEGISPWSNIHTIFISHNAEEVKNLTELPVLEDQIHARSMIKSFTAAAANARQKYGPDVKHLPEPIIVQCIESNGKNFHFSVFQLNTLDINKIEGIRNFWWSSPTLQLYEKACYEVGKPILTGYNPEVVKKLFAFYKNI